MEGDVRAPLLGRRNYDSGEENNLVYGLPILRLRVFWRVKVTSRAYIGIDPHSGLVAPCEAFLGNLQAYTALLCSFVLLLRLCCLYEKL